MDLHPIKTDTLKNPFDLITTIEKYLKKNSLKLRNGDILIISSKIVALSQGRIVDLSKITPRKKAKNIKKSRYGIHKEDPRITELVLREADYVVPGSMLLSIKDNIFIASAGIDASNAPAGQVILWPKNAWAVTKKIWMHFKSISKLKKFGVIICDSHCTPLRWGVSGISLSWAGFEGIEDARGEKDIYGNPLIVTRKAVADNLSSAALILMGEGSERIPMVLARNVPAKFTSRPQGNPKEISMNPKDDIFSGIYNAKFLKMVGSK